MSTRVALELALAVGGLAALIGTVAFERRRGRLLSQVGRLAAQLAGGAAPVPVPGSLRGLVATLEQIGQQLTTLREGERGQLEKALRVSEAVLEAMIDPVLVFDESAQISRYNSASKRLFGETIAIGAAAAALGDPLLQLAAEEASIGFPVASNQVPHVDLMQKNARRRFRVRASPLPGGGPPGAVLVLQDVTESDAEADRLRHAAQSALFELRPLVDALGAALLAPGGKKPSPGLDEWRAIDQVMRDVEGSAGDQPPTPVDLDGFVEEALDAIAIEAQRRGVKLRRSVERPAPRPVTDPSAMRRLLLRTVRTALRGLKDGDILSVAVRTLPGPAVRITPGVSETTPLDGILVDRAQVLVLTERSDQASTTVLQFTRPV